MPNYRKFEKRKKVGEDFVKIVEMLEPGASVIKIDPIEQVRFHIETGDWVVFLGDNDKIAKIEHTVYPPKTKHNEDFILTLIENPFVNYIYMGKRTDGLKRFLLRENFLSDNDFNDLKLIIFKANAQEIFINESIEDLINIIYDFVKESSLVI